jgi:hypothetical protein
MDIRRTLEALETEKRLLEEFICLSQQQLLILAEEDLSGFDLLLQKRAALMMKLTAVETTLANWIRNIRMASPIPPASFAEMRRLNEEIVRMADHVIEVDRQAHLEFDRIRQQTNAEIIDIRSRRKLLLGVT